MVRKRSSVEKEEDGCKVKRPRRHEIHNLPPATQPDQTHGSKLQEKKDQLKSNTSVVNADKPRGTLPVNDGTPDKDGILNTISGKENTKSDVLTNETTSTSNQTILPSQKTSFDQSVLTPQNMSTMTSQGPVLARVVRPLAERSRNIVHCLSQTVAGMRCSLELSMSVSAPAQSLVRGLQLYRTARPFDRRCTALEWHPRRPGWLAVASKGGDLILWDTSKMGHEQFIEGSGPGGSCQALRFMPGTDTQVLTASIDGTVRMRDLTGKHSRVLLDTHNCESHWYCSVDVHPGDGVVATGDNFGRVTLLDGKGNESWTHKLHSRKVTHTEFHPRAPWMLCTASLDKTCKLWDIRMVKDRKSALHVLEHATALNSAYFNPAGSELLITDQKNEIRVYSGPAWRLRTSVPHPHRFFRHITPVKACWHPLADMMAVGRYPDKNFAGSSADERRSVDVFCTRTGKMLCQLYDPSTTGVISLNKFSPEGDTLASTMGVSVLIWSRKELVAKKQDELMVKYSRENSNTDPSNGIPGNESSGNHGNSTRGRIKGKQTKEKNTKSARTTKTEKKAAREKLAKLHKS